MRKYQLKEGVTDTDIHGSLWRWLMTITLSIALHLNIEGCLYFPTWVCQIFRNFVDDDCCLTDCYDNWRCFQWSISKVRGLGFESSKIQLFWFPRSAPEECPLNDGNLLTVKLFIKNVDMCLQFCQADQMCNYYKFYDAQDGKPPQCFLYETCGRTVGK